MSDIRQDYQDIFDSHEEQDRNRKWILGELHQMAIRAMDRHSETLPRYQLVMAGFSLARGYYDDVRKDIRRGRIASDEAVELLNKAAEFGLFGYGQQRNQRLIDEHARRFRETVVQS